MCFCIQSEQCLIGLDLIGYHQILLQTKVAVVVWGLADYWMSQTVSPKNFWPFTSVQYTFPELSLGLSVGKDFQL